jgi:hypothetical protein
MRAHEMRAQALASIAMRLTSLLIVFRPVLCRPGGYSGEPEPDPIPNSAVKLPCADGTKSQDLGE